LTERREKRREEEQKCLNKKELIRVIREYDAVMRGGVKEEDPFDVLKAKLEQMKVELEITDPEGAVAGFFNLDDIKMLKDALEKAGFLDFFIELYQIEGDTLKAMKEHAEFLHECEDKYTEFEEKVDEALSLINKWFYCYNDIKCDEEECEHWRGLDSYEHLVCCTKDAYAVGTCRNKILRIPQFREKIELPNKKMKELRRILQPKEE